MLDNRNSVIKTVNIFYRTILYPSVSEVANVLTNCGAVAEQKEERHKNIAFLYTEMPKSKRRYLIVPSCTGFSPVDECINCRYAYPYDIVRKKEPITLGYNGRPCLNGRDMPVTITYAITSPEDIQ